MTLYFQQTLPTQVVEGQWVRIEFVQFGPAVLFVEEIHANRIIGFDLFKCEKVSLRLRHDRAVLNTENWWPRSYDTPLSAVEVHNYVATRQKQIAARIAETRTTLTYLEAFAARYVGVIPEQLDLLPE